MADTTKNKSDLLDEITTLRAEISELRSSRAELVKLKTRLEESEANYKSIFDNIQDVYYRADMEGRLLLVSPSGASLLGYKNIEEMAEMNIADEGYYDNDERDRFMLKILKSGFVKSFLVRLKKKNGSPIFVETSSHVFRDTAGNPLFIEGIFRDVTERKITEDSIRQYQENLEELVEERTRKLKNANELLLLEISERKKAEEALRSSEEKYRHLVENANEAILIIFDGNISFSNSMVTEITGYSIDEITRMKFYDIVYPDDRDKIITYHNQRLMGKDVPKLYDIRIITKSKELRWIQINAVRIDWSGSPAALALITDISDKKKSEIALQESESKFRALTESSPSAIFIIQGSKLRYVNQAFLDISGYSRDELGTMDFWDMVHPDYKEITIQRGLNRQKGEIELQRYEFMALHKSGKPIWLDYAASIIEYDKKPAVLGSGFDITDRKKADQMIQEQIQEIHAQNEELEAINKEVSRTHGELIQAYDRLEEEKERLSTTLRSLSEGVITTDIKGNVDILNKAAETITGRIQDSSRGMPISEIAPMTDTNSGKNVENPIYSSLAEGRTIEIDGDYAIITPKGKHLVSASSSPVRDAYGVIIGAVLVLRDVTVRRMMEETLLKASRIESLGVFAGGIAHDFNNLLTAIIGSISFSIEKIKKNENSNDMLVTAEKAALRARDLTQQLLTFSSGGDPIRKITRISDLISETADFVMSGSNIRFIHEIPPDIWNADIDPGQVSQVIHNILINARQAMPDGGSIRLSVQNYRMSGDTSLPLDEGDYIKITISDSGSGIPREKLPYIFDPYFSTKNTGSGLGLAISYSIVKKHGGLIMVDSSVNRGTIFEIYLPASRMPVTEASPVACEHVFTRGHILVMDDDEMVLHVASEMLKYLHCDVACALHGEEALNKYRQAVESGNPFDLVIMDLTIPGRMGGKETVKRLREFHEGARVIVSSGYSNDPVMSNYLEYGFNGMIMKPYHFDELREAIQSVLGQ
ncbi:MAG: PAS domain S-box protein [Spirochaetes bacterium]|nr:PAS domain S-box protein [Spirochaetota bacterium]